MNLRVLTSLGMTASLAALAGCAGKPSSQPCVTSLVLSVSPATATLNHSGTPPGNQQQYTAYTSEVVVSGACAVPAIAVPVTIATWTTSDPFNTTISNVQPTSGLATCINPTSAPATITATVPNGSTTLSKTAQLSCN